jgi:hypothetical protein
MEIPAPCGLKSGEPVTFEALHIIQIERADETDPEP